MSWTSYVSAKLACIASVSARVWRESLDESTKEESQGGGGEDRRKRFLFSPPLPLPSIFHFFPSCSIFRAITWLETVAKQASSKLFKFVINDSFSNNSTWNRQSTFWIALAWEAFTLWSCFRSASLYRKKRVPKPLLPILRAAWKRLWKTLPYH